MDSSAIVRVDRILHGEYLMGPTRGMFRSLHSLAKARPGARLRHGQHAGVSQTRADDAGSLPVLRRLSFVKLCVCVCGGGMLLQLLCVEVGIDVDVDDGLDENLTDACKAV